MKPLAIFLCVASQFFLVAGQLLFKHAMNEKDPKPRPVMVRLLVLGIATQTMWFFLWLGLLQDWPLSKIFPFEGLNPVLIVLAATVFLKERLTLEGWIGIILISAGIGLVTSS